MSEAGEQAVGTASQDAAAPAYKRFDCTGDDPEAIARAVEAARAAIERGECVVLPTDTVYGVGADAFSPDAVQRLLDAKIRGRDMPPPVLIAEPSLIRALATEVPEQAKDLVARHWPGPLTIICKRQPSLRMDLGDVEDSVALRVPDHELAREVLRSTGPMAVSSANISGMPATTTVQDAIDQLWDRVAVYLDGGDLDASGAPSTIVDFTQSPDGEILRHGALSTAVLRETCPDIVDLVESDEDVTGAEMVEDPGPEDVGPEEIVEADVVEMPDPDPAALKAEIEKAGDLAPPTPPYREPTTDELGITHADVDPHQPDLFSEADRSDAK